jgi:hypothetical protein
MRAAAAGSRALIGGVDATAQMYATEQTIERSMPMLAMDVRAGSVLVNTVAAMPKPTKR